MRYRVDELATATGVSVDTLRFYQARGLLPRPEREGRVVWYGEAHRERLAQIRELKSQGFSLAMIGRVLSGELDAGGQALALALAGPLPGDEPATGGERFGLAELAARTGASVTVLEALEREGLLVGRGEDETPYTAADAAAVQGGLALLAAGVPLSELLAVARAHDEAMRTLAATAVELFARYVRDPLRVTATSEEEAAAAMVGALHAMLPAAEGLVAHHFRRRLLAAAQERVAGSGASTRAEPAALEGEPERRAG